MGTGSVQLIDAPGAGILDPEVTVVVEHGGRGPGGQLVAVEIGAQRIPGYDGYLSGLRIKDEEVSAAPYNSTSAVRGGTTAPDAVTRSDASSTRSTTPPRPSAT